MTAGLAAFKRWNLQAVNARKIEQLFPCFDHMGVNVELV
jgi:hypothetical protein